MKKKLDKEMLDAVCGGFILRQPDGTYIVYGRDDLGVNLWVSFGNDFYKALKFEWKHFKNQYKAAYGIHTENELKKFYNRDFLNPQAY